MNESSGRNWSGGERRKSGRTVYSRGPIILALETLSALTGLAAVAALAFSLSVFTGRISLIQQSRQRSATDSCYLFRAVVLKASLLKHQIAAGEAFLNSVGLSNCHAFGANVTRLDK